MKSTQIILATVLAATALSTTANAQTPTAAVSANPARSVVLVHGAFADGSGWRGVYLDEQTIFQSAHARQPFTTAAGSPGLASVLKSTVAVHSSSS